MPAATLPPWHRSTTHALVAYLEKEGAEVGKVMSYRLLTITAPLYRCYATMRLRCLATWIASWALPEMHAGVPELGAVDAWMEVLSTIEDLTMDRKNYCGGTADIAKFFDQIRRTLVFRIAKAAGMPQPVLTAYQNYIDNLLVYNCLAGGIGKPYRRRCGIPQGCPYSMAMVALIMRPWVLLMRTMVNIQCYILADDVLIVATGNHMIRNFTKALDATHLYLHTMGAKIAPAKSFNFATHPRAKRWLENHTWLHIKDKIKVVKDLRYLGAHIHTGSGVASSTLDDRLLNAQVQLKRLRFCPAGTKAKIRAILTRVFAGAFYGVEAARITPAKLAKFGADIIDTFKQRNNNHNVDRFYATTTKAKDDLDPVTQVMSRRVLQMRRTSCKKEGAKLRFQRTLQKYVKKHEVDGRAPNWYYQHEDNSDDYQHNFPPAQPHPSTNEYDKQWDKHIEPQGPIGLLIESIVWSGMAIDQDLRIWQNGEQPIDIFNTPYQCLKPLVMQAATRARTRAEWGRATGNAISNECREIDRELSQVNHHLSEVEQGFVRMSLIGSNMSKCEIAKYNEDIDTTCNYCKEAESTSDHIKWECSYFKPIREKIDPLLAKVPLSCLPINIRNGIAPAMRISGDKTYLGTPSGGRLG